MVDSQFHIGTSGWFYEHWKELFYPLNMKSSDRLQFYAEHFKTVEINNTFYRLPTEKAVKGWFSKVPKDFVFSVKATGYITHRKRLKDFSQSSKDFFERILALGDKRGPILFQLPPSFKKDLERLEEALPLLKNQGRCTFEFRHPTWYCDEVYDLLKKHSIALCITDLKGTLSPTEVTSDFTYIRLHGPKSAYQGQYGIKRLKFWQNKIETWQKNKIAVYCYFDNDEKSYAIQDALLLKSLM